MTRVGPYVTDPLTGKATAEERPNLHYEIENPETGDTWNPDPSRGWITDEAGLKRLLDDRSPWWPPNPATGKPRKKRFLSETRERMPASSFWSDLKGQSGARMNLTILMGERVFAFPKAVDFIRRVLDYATDKDSLILDSFAGSGHNSTCGSVSQQGRCRKSSLHPDRVRGLRGEDHGRTRPPGDKGCRRCEGREAARGSGRDASATSTWARRSRWRTS